MITIKNSTIEYTKDDTMRLTISAKTSFSKGSTLRFIIARDETSNYLIDTTVSLNAEGRFVVDLPTSEKNKLDIENYKYKCVLISIDGTVITQKSGDFIVKWGA